MTLSPSPRTQSGVEFSPSNDTDASQAHVSQVGTPNTAQRLDIAKLSVPPSEGRGSPITPVPSPPPAEPTEPQLSKTDICAELGKAEGYLEYLIHTVESQAPQPQPGAAPHAHEKLLFESRAIERGTYELEAALIEAELTEIEKSREIEVKLTEAVKYHDMLLKRKEPANPDSVVSDTTPISKTTQGLTCQAVKQKKPN